MQNRSFRDPFIMSGRRPAAHFASLRGREQLGLISRNLDGKRREEPGLVESMFSFHQ